MKMRPYYPRVPLLPRILFCLAVAVAFILLALVLISPWLDQVDWLDDGWNRLVAVFARDAPVRRIALAGAMGLFITACVFFRAPFWRRRGRKPPGPPWQNVVGA
jgi:hypothetical protein